MKPLRHFIAMKALLAALLGVTLLGGCATQAPPYDLSAFIKAKPVTLLVMPPLNDSPDVKATPAVWAQSTRPLAEAGYYVLPVTLVDETFKQNGVFTATEAQEVPYAKLRDYFGADAAVYLKVTKYGTSFQVLASETRVDVEARVVDLRDGTLLWPAGAGRPGGLVGHGLDQTNCGRHHRCSVWFCRHRQRPLAGCATLQRRAGGAPVTAVRPAPTCAMTGW
jgi:hypothetical protein